MADISNLKSNERSNVERVKLYESHCNKKFKLRRQSVEINLYQRANIRISKIASGAQYRMDEQFQNLLILIVLQM